MLFVGVRCVYGYRIGGVSELDPSLVDRIIIMDSSAQHACAILANGDALCWGWNHYTQLGVGDANDHSYAARVLGLGSAVKDTALGQ